MSDHETIGGVLERIKRDWRACRPDRRKGPKDRRAKDRGKQDRRDKEEDRGNRT